MVLQEKTNNKMRGPLLILIIFVLLFLYSLWVLFSTKILDPPGGFVREAFRRVAGKKRVSNLVKKKAINKMVIRFLKHTYERDILVWPEFGTLLGIIREGDVICYDDDADLSFLISDWGKLKQSTEEFISKYKRYYYISIDLFNLKGILIVDKKIGTHMDLIPRINRNGILKTTLINQDPGFGIEDILPLQEAHGVNLSVRVFVPRNYELMLKTWYGKYYMIPDKKCDDGCENCVNSSG